MTNELELQQVLEKLESCKLITDSLAYCCKSLQLNTNNSSAMSKLQQALQKAKALQLLCEVEVANLRRPAAPQRLNTRISYILNTQNLLFYVFDTNPQHMQNIAQLINNMDKLQQIEVSPNNYELVFGIKLDNCIWRTKFSKQRGFLHLLDVGEEIAETQPGYVKYKLDKQTQDMPALALLCKLTGVEGDNGAVEHDLQLLLQNSFNECIFLNIINTVEGIHFVKFVCNTVATVAAAEHNDAALPLYALTSEVDTFESSPTTLEYGTTNALQAVLGYVPKDEQRLCRFYNAKQGDCFKGANCHKDHELGRQAGFTKDCVLASEAYNFNHPIVLYQKQQVLNVTLTHLNSLVSFYAQINTEEAQKKLIWCREQIPAYKLYTNSTKTPLLLDLVLARYKDNLWYRGRIFELHENARYEVYFVDYGNSDIVDLADMAVCFQNARQYPDRASLMYLADYQQMPLSNLQYKLVREKFMQRLLNQTFEVRLISQEIELEVEFVEHAQIQLIDEYVQKQMIRKINRKNR